MSKENIKLIRIILHIEKNAEFAIHTLYISVNKMPNVCRYICRLNSSIDHRNSLSKESEVFLFSFVLIILFPLSLSLFPYPSPPLPIKISVIFHLYFQPREQSLSDVRMSPKGYKSRQ